MADQIPSAAVTTDWLADHLDEPGIRILASESETVTATGSSRAAAGRDLRAEFETGHIPGAELFSLEEVCDREATLLNTLPPAEQFSSRVGALGVSNDDFVVIYDSLGVRTSPRAWWMFRVFGHDRVAVLDGGLPAWKQKGHSIESGPAECTCCEFSAHLRNELIVDVRQMMQIQKDRTIQVVDGRPANRYHGKAPEPRGDIPSGHMPWSVSIPSDLVVDAETGALFPLDTLRKNFEDAGVALDKPIATTCGWGIAACQVALGLYVLGNTDAAIYDGSWLEWASRDDTEIEKS